MILLFLLTFTGCSDHSPDKTKTTTSRAEETINNADKNDYNEINETQEEPERTGDILTPQKAISILTESGKLWYRTGSSPSVGQWDQHYYIFYDRGGYVECEWHIYDEVKIGYTLRFYTDENNKLMMEFDDGSFRSGTFKLTDDYWDASGSYTEWYIDEEFFVFPSYNLQKGEF